MTITALTPLDRTASTFKADVDTFFATDLPAFVAEANSLEANVNAKEITASSAAVTATTQAGLATTNGAAQVALATTQAGIATTQAGLATTNGAAQVVLATSQAAAAAASAASALNAPGTSSTSTTSLTIATGSKTMTIQTGKAYSVGQGVVIANTATPANYMAGQITAYDSGTGSLIVNAISIGGSGTFTEWSISMSAVFSTVASAISNTPAGNISATTVQAAINELDGEKAALAGSAAQSFSILNGTVAGTLAVSDKVTISTSNSGGLGGVAIIRNGAVSAAGNAAALQFFPSISYTSVYVGAAVRAVMGTGTDVSLVFDVYNSGSNPGAMTISPLGAVTIPGTISLTGPSSTLGYGAGAGGTVTQATSKSTAVTLNKPCGQITMNNASLAANTAVSFNIACSLAAAADVVIVNVVAGISSELSYTVTGCVSTAGTVNIVLRNISGGSLSEAVVLQFAIIKGATS